MGSPMRKDHESWELETQTGQGGHRATNTGSTNSAQRHIPARVVIALLTLARQILPNVTFEQQFVGSMWIISSVGRRHGRHSRNRVSDRKIIQELLNRTLPLSVAESAQGISPRAAHRSGRDTLASSGSCHRAKAAAFR